MSTNKSKSKDENKKDGKPKKLRKTQKKLKLTSAEKKLAEKRRVEQNKTISKIKYVYGGLLALIILYLLYFVFIESNDLVINSYNPRLETIEENIVRGSILDRDLEPIAYSVELEEGEIVRLYPYDNAFCHVVGYATQGKTGLEALANIDLLQSNLSVLENIKYDFSNNPLPGNDIVTTLDVDLQLLAYDLLGDNKGAIIAMEPSTGKILAMVSKPDFDPNYIVEEWEALLEDEENSPLLNRATQGLYPPGSTFKLLTAAEYLAEYDERDFVYFCDSADFFGGEEIHCAGDTAHGRVDLETAFAKSCNTAFATIGQQINGDEFNVFCNNMLFNSQLPFSLPYSISSFSLDGDSSAEEVAETAIGQGETMMTPLHNLLVTASVANGGILMTPYLIDSVYSDNGELLVKNYPIVYDALLDVDMTSQLTGYMVEVVNNGTATGVQSKDYQVAAKTGSAENPFGDTHAWFVGFAPSDHPEIALVILVENAGSSSQNAVPIANEILEFYFKGNSF